MLEWHSIACCLNMFTPDMQAIYMYMYIEKSVGLKQKQHAYRIFIAHL